MKTKVIILGAIFAASLTACSDHDNKRIDELYSRMGGVEERLTTLETWQKTANENILALQKLADALEKRNYVSAVQETENGYVVTLGDGTEVTIINGMESNVPTVTVKEDSDGVLYWVVNGEWLLDEDGNKVPASSVAPQVKINPTTNNWEVSTDGGQTWKELTDSEGNPVPAVNATGGGFLLSAPEVDEESGVVTFVLLDGTKLEVPYFDSFKAVCDRIQSLVYMPDYTDGKMTISDVDGATATLRYMVKPAVLATYMGNHAEMLHFTLHDGLNNRRAAAGATLTINGVNSSVDGDNGIVTIEAESAGFKASEGYAVALCFNDGASDYITAFTPVWVKMGNPTAAIVAADGTKAGATVGAGKGLQLNAIISEGDEVKSWTTDDKNVAVIDQEGWLSLLSEGTVTVTLTTVQGASATFSLKVSAGAVGAQDDGYDQDRAEVRGKR